MFNNKELIILFAFFLPLIILLTKPRYAIRLFDKVKNPTKFQIIFSIINSAGVLILFLYIFYKYDF